MPPLPPSATGIITACATVEATAEQALQNAWVKSKAARIDSFKIALFGLIGAAMVEEVYGDPPTVSVDEVYPVEPLPYVVAPFAGARLKLQATDFLDGGDAVYKITATWSGAPPIIEIFTKHRARFYWYNYCAP